MQRPCLSQYPATLRTSQTLPTDRKHMQGKDYVCCRILYTIENGKSPSRKKNTNSAFCSQPRWNHRD